MALGKLLGRIRAWLEEPPPQPAPPQATPAKPSLLDQLIQENLTSGEKRASTRRSVQIRADLVDSFNGLPFPVALENLSDHGIYFASDSGLRLGSIVQATLRFPADVDRGRRQVHLLGRIVRVEPKTNGRFGIAARIMGRRTLS